MGETSVLNATRPCNARAAGVHLFASLKDKPAEGTAPAPTRPWPSARSAKVTTSTTMTDVV